MYLSNDPYMIKNVKIYICFINQSYEKYIIKTIKIIDVLMIKVPKLQIYDKLGMRSLFHFDFDL